MHQYCYPEALGGLASDCQTTQDATLDRFRLHCESWGEAKRVELVEVKAVADGSTLDTTAMRQAHRLARHYDWTLGAMLREQADCLFNAFGHTIHNEIAHGQLRETELRRSNSNMLAEWTAWQAPTRKRVLPQFGRPEVKPEAVALPALREDMHTFFMRQIR